MNEGLGPLPKEHERAPLVRKAENDLTMQWSKTMQKYDLTVGERLRVLSNVLSNLIGSVAKYAIRHERHGSGDKPGDLE